MQGKLPADADTHLLMSKAWKVSLGGKEAGSHRNSNLGRPKGRGDFTNCKRNPAVVQLTFLNALQVLKYVAFSIFSVVGYCWLFYALIWPLVMIESMEHLNFVSS